MSRIVLTAHGSLGDLYPLIGLAIELRDRGHEIIFATVKDYRSRIEAIGFEYRPMRPDHVRMDDEKMLELMMDLRKGPERVFRDYYLPSIRDMYSDLTAAAEGADLIVAGELIYAARIVSEVMQIPWVLCVLAPLSFFSIYDPLVLPAYEGLDKLRIFGTGANRAVINFAKFISRNWGEPLHQLRRELGLQPIKHPFVGQDKYSTELNLALFSSVLGAPQPDWNSKMLQTGFVFFDGQAELNPKLEQFLAAGEAPIVFTLGSAAVHTAGNFYQQSLEAVRQLNRRAVFLIGKNPPPENLPETVIAIDYVPFSQIFPRASAIVHQGGVGTTGQALRAGKPTIVVPYSHDQPDNALRVERLGTSRTIKRDRYSVSKVVEALTDLNNPKYAIKAAEVGEIVRSEDGVKVACDAIESQLAAISL
ncbi:glycosyltransferase [Leptolyngbya sp. AN03gr2]